ncbi:MAG: flagellar basal body-associated FliL family protein [Desulfatiglandaceae bacterium]
MSTKKLFILIGGLLVTGLIGGGVFFYLQKGNTEKSVPATDAEETKNREMEALLLKKRINFPLESFIVNLADPGGKRYLSTRIVLELNDKDHIDALEKKVSQIRDRILMILPTKTFKDIQSVEGKNTLRNTLIEELNAILQEGEITNIYFQEFVVQ